MKSGSVQVFAPATVANVAVGFDILGFAVDGVGDMLTLTRTDKTGIEIEPIKGLGDSSAIPTDPALNTAGLPLLQMLERFQPGFGFSLRVEKGIPLGSGMGGSAASAVGAVVAAHALFLQEEILSHPLPLAELLQYALEGEGVASGAKHADNIAPCLYGGMTLTNPGEHPDVVAVPYPNNLYCVLVHPNLRVDTKTARKILKADLPLKTHVQQSARLASFLLGCTGNHLSLIRRGLEDLVIEPQRAPLIPGFYEVQKSAMAQGALGCSISGAGPAMFAFAENKGLGDRIKSAMIHAFQAAGLPAQGWVSTIRARGAEVL